VENTPKYVRRAANGDTDAEKHYAILPTTDAAQYGGVCEFRPEAHK